MDSGPSGCRESPSIERQDRDKPLLRPCIRRERLYDRERPGGEIRIVPREWSGSIPVTFYFEGVGFLSRPSYADVYSRRIPACFP